MTSASLPENEAARLADLHVRGLLDSAPDAELDAITRLAADVIEVPMAGISLVGADRQWFKARVGLETQQLPRELSFCAHVVGSGARLVVHDTRNDPRLADNPLVTGAPHLRFYAGVPLFTRGGHCLGTLCALDVKPNTPSQRQLRMLDELAGLVVARLETLRQLALTRQVVDGVPGMLAYWDTEQRCQFANAAYRDWFGISPSDLIGRSLRDLLGPLYARNQPFIDAALQGQPQAFEREIPRPDGSGPPRHGQAHYLPHVVGDKVLGFVVLVTDITSQKALEHELAGRLREREVLLQEVHHRVKNNLQVIASLINMQVRGLSEATAISALRECQGRVLAISLIHERLYRSTNSASVPFESYARSLVETILQAHTVEAGRVVPEFDLCEVSFPADRAIALALIVNELVTNAVKHAFPGGRHGTVRVALTPPRDGRLTLTVADDGVGPADSHPTVGSSFGFDLVNTLTAQLGGTLEATWSPSTTVRVSLPEHEQTS